MILGRVHTGTDRCSRQPDDVNSEKHLEKLRFSSQMKSQTLRRPLFSRGWHVCGLMAKDSRPTPGLRAEILAHGAEDIGFQHWHPFMQRSFEANFPTWSMFEARATGSCQDRVGFARWDHARIAGEACSLQCLE